VDGGYSKQYQSISYCRNADSYDLVDNLPVSAMFSMGASAVIACDVGSVSGNLVFPETSFIKAH
jgi:hypothetical protein